MTRLKRSVSKTSLPRREIRVLGVDPSLTSTGFAYRAGDEVMTGTICGGDMRGAMRLFHMRQYMKNLLESVMPTHVSYEDYALNKRLANQQGVFSTGELGGIFKSLFYEFGVYTILVPPTSLKLIITGNGQGGGDDGKAIMKAALERDFGLVIPQSDEADAAGLMLVGEMRTGSTTLIPDERKSNRIKSLQKCEMVRGRLKLISNGTAN